MYRTFVLILVLITIGIKAGAQPSPSAALIRKLRKDIPDSTRSKLLLELGTAYVERIGERPSDLDSALAFALDAVKLYSKVHDTAGMEAATLLTGRIHSEAKRYDQAESLLPQLSYDNRLTLLQTIILYRTNTNGNDWRDADSAIHLCRELIDLSHSRNRYIEEACGWLDLGIFYYWLNKGSDARNAFLHGWEVQKKAKNIEFELDYLSTAIRWSAKDSAFDGDARRLRHAAHQDINTLINTKSTAGSKREAVHGFNRIGSAYKIANRMDLALEATRETVEIGRTFDPYFILPLYSLSGLELSNGMLQDALQHALAAVRITESAPSAEVDGLAYQAAGKVYLALNDLPKSLDYYRKAMGIFFTRPSLATDKIALRDMTSIFVRLGRPAEALAFLDTAEQKLQFSEDVDQNFVAESRGDCYFALHRYDEAEKCYLQSLQNGNTRFWFRASGDYESLARVYAAKAQYGKAIPYLKALAADSNRFQTGTERRRNALFQLYQADSAVGNFREAFTYLEQYQRLKDSAFNDTTSKQLQEITLKYETEKKDRNIARLTSEAQLRDTELSRGRVLRNSLIIAAFVLIILVAVLYNRYLFRQRSNRLLKQMNAQQSGLLVEKEWLMREIHHRVKNNLQLVISLLNMQADTLKNEPGLNAFDAILGRIRTISLIHQKLYQDQTDVTHINMRDYITQQVNLVQDGIDPKRRIRFRIAVDSPDLDISRCVAVGLILNEAITNAIKYAFPKGEDASRAEYPTIDVELKQIGKYTIRLLIADNGSGFEGGAGPRGSSLAGMQLIHALALQLEGTLSEDYNAGHRIVIAFDIHPVHDDLVDTPVLNESFN